MDAIELTGTSAQTRRIWKRLRDRQLLARRRAPMLGALDPEEVRALIVRGSSVDGFTMAES